MMKLLSVGTCNLGVVFCYWFSFFFFFLVLPTYWPFNNVSMWVVSILVLMLLTEFLRRQKEYVKFSSVNK